MSRPALAWLLAAVLTSPAWAGEPTVVDTGYEIVPRTLSRSLYWLDSSRLLFEGINSAQLDAALAAHAPRPVGRLKKLYLWDAARRSVSLYAEGSGLCVADGVAHYLAPRQQAPARAPSGSVYSPFTCRRYLRSQLSPPALPGRRVLVLRAGDGYLDAGPVAIDARTAEMHAEGGGRVRLFAAGSARPIELPFTLGQGPGHPSYSAYLGVYVTVPRPRNAQPGIVTRWPRGLAATVYTFRSSGITGEMIIPYGDWGEVALPQPSSAGWIFAGRGARTRQAGLFLFSGGAVRRLDSGYVYEIAVTPDGCRAAVAIKNRLLEIDAPTHVKVFDLCSG